jgi:hypothetical protein
MNTKKSNVQKDNPDLPAAFVSRAIKANQEKDNDMVMSALLSYLDNEMVKNPKDIIPVDQNLLDEIGDLVKEVE